MDESTPVKGVPKAPPQVRAPRRRDRGQDDGWIRAFLHGAPFGFLATVDEGRPFLNSNLFLYRDEEHAIYFHTARTGRTPENVARGGRCCFSAASMGRFLPAREALEFSVEYAAVVVFGTIAPVDALAARRRALEGIMARYAPHLKPGRDYRRITDDELRRTAVHRLDIESWSGKENTADPDFPGAYHIEPEGGPMSVPEPGSTSPTPSAAVGDGAPAPEAALSYFTTKLAMETDPADVHRDMEGGLSPFTLVDVRSPAHFKDCHIPGAINLPAGAISPTTTRRLDRERLVVVHCWGPGCNGATKAAARLSALGFRVKEMIGGIEYWRREGLPVEGTLGDDAPLVG